MIFVVCLVDSHGELTPLFACHSEETARQVAANMGDAGTVVAIPLFDEER
jgi:hypothetical protein